MSKRSHDDSSSIDPTQPLTPTLHQPDSLQDDLASEHNATASRVSRPSPAKDYLFTWNNPDRDLAQFVSDVRQSWSDLEYMVVQLERGESGTPHLQGFCIFKRKLRITQLKKLPHGAKYFHWEKRRGTREQARDYCMKEDTREDGPVEIGEMPVSEQGKRSDLHRIAELITGGTPMSEIYADPHNAPALIRYGRHFDSYIGRCLQYRPRPVPDVILFYGPSGCGKTSYVYDTYSSIYRVPAGNNVWFSGYTGEATILWDDFTGAASHCRLDLFLQATDRYPLQVGTKGSHTSLINKTFCITTNIHPRLWWKWTNREEQYSAVVRRFTRCFYWPRGARVPLILDRGDSEHERFFSYRPVLTEPIDEPDRFGIRIVNQDPYNIPI
jgi:hypothetical protein